MQGRTTSLNHHLSYISSRLSVMDFLCRFVGCMTFSHFEATMPIDGQSVCPLCGAMVIFEQLSEQVQYCSSLRHRDGLICLVARLTCTLSMIQFTVPSMR
jgi:hypothetical protein